MIYPMPKRNSWPKFYRDYRLGLDVHSWIVIWKWNGKWRHIGAHRSYSNYDSIRRPW